MQKFYDTKLQNLQLLLKCIWGDCLIQERHIGYPREILKYNLICNSKEGVEAWNTLSSFRKIKDANRNNLVSGLSQKLCCREGSRDIGFLEIPDFFMKCRFLEWGFCLGKVFRWCLAPLPFTFLEWNENQRKQQRFRNMCTKCIYSV